MIAFQRRNLDSRQPQRTMQTSNVADKPIATDLETRRQALSDSQRRIKVGLLTGCKDRHYAFGLAMALAAKDVNVDVVGSDEIDSPELHVTPNLRFLNFVGDQRSKTSFAKKLSRTLVYYGKLSGYAGHTESEVLHILWNNKFEFFDRTLLMLYYRLCGKKVVFTAHNVNAGERDGQDSFLNR